jgi:hypothetical protein
VADFTIRLQASTLILDPISEVLFLATVISTCCNLKLNLLVAVTLVLLYIARNPGRLGLITLPKQ